MSERWIKSYEKLLDWEWTDDPYIFVFWVKLLLLVNVKAKRWHGKTIKRGQLLTSMRHLEERLGWSHHTIQRILDALQSTGEIIVESSNDGTLITVVNFSKYQGEGVANDATQPATPTATLDATHSATLSATPGVAPNATNIRNIDSIEREERKNILIPSPNARAREIGIEKFGSFSNVYLHPVEHRTLVMNYGEELTEKAVDDLSCKIAEGDEQANSSLNHYATLDRWLRYKIEKSPKAPMSSNSTTTETEEQKCRRIWSMMKKEDQEQHLKENDGLYPWEDPRYNKSLTQQEHGNAK